ncbi:MULTISPECIES: hypothetical protein [Cupriavidus]|jgi:hypothetical protein|uniref:hypothetical protein n=1 Tax=Cupriavidus TaxID=106589 RepID=UPI0004632B92|nr:hypothetical protein [Cupriavidus metallidurans]AVA38316.1 hypothetical protein C3Z06_32445 [Cupriavidus metallidurans]KWW32318.1 hypothetical protein AU374_05918 [Cupriavidus metallidurans]
MFTMTTMARDEFAEDDQERAFNAWLRDVRKAMGGAAADEDLAHSLYVDGADVEDAVGELQANAIGNATLLTV